MSGKLNMAGAGLVVAIASLSLAACNKPADKPADASAAPAADAAAPAAVQPSGSLTEGAIKDPDQTAKTGPAPK